MLYVQNTRLSVPPFSSCTFPSHIAYIFLQVNGQHINLAAQTIKMRHWEHT